MKKTALIATVASVLLAMAGNAQTTVSGTIAGHDYVDLGLSVKWATCNVGASSPSDYGDYFAWGETTTKSEYTKENCKTMLLDDEISGNPQYDAARANWGGSWRMPTEAELLELIRNCKWKWTSENGCNGYKMTSKINGNSIFLPASGLRFGSSLDKAGEGGHYRCSTRRSNRSRPMSIYFGAGGLGPGFEASCLGFSVRPVFGVEPVNHTASTPAPRSTPEPQPATGTIAGHDYVDLGLSVKWATCNVGASSPSDYGNYYAWGETTTKSEYTSDNCKTREKNIGNIAGNSAYDAARANWGGSWRMPTEIEMRELRYKCTWIWTSQGGHNGWKVTSKTNGNSIFLPAAGCRDGSSLYAAGEGGHYWSSMPDEGRTQFAYYLNFYNDYSDMCWSYRSYGRSVRPVFGVEPVNNIASTPAPRSTPEPQPAMGTIAGHDYVDLGLSVKWATCNVGASSPSDYGNYYAWGETSTKSTYTKGNSKTYNKNMDDISGNSAYDAARANWGESWRMPTKSEMQELKDKCTWIWTSQGDHNGYKVTSKINGNSIFLPVAGYKSKSSLNLAGKGGDYWSSTPYESDTQGAYYLDFGSGGYGMHLYYRYYGFGVRPVSD